MNKIITIVIFAAFFSHESMSQTKTLNCGEQVKINTWTVRCKCPGTLANFSTSQGKVGTTYTIKDVLRALEYNTITNELEKEKFLKTLSPAAKEIINSSNEELKEDLLEMEKSLLENKLQNTNKILKNK
jgi:hypothetical protein